MLLVARNFIEIATTVDDQNIYLDPPTRLYINKGISRDSLAKGSLLLKINDKKLITEIQVYRYLDEFQKDEIIEFQIFQLTPYDSILGYADTIKINRSDIPENFVEYLPSCVVIADVVEGGVSDRAGLKTGDLITRINKRYFSNGEDAHRMVASNPRGSDVTYTILRDGLYDNIEIELAKFELPIDYLIVFFAGLLIALTGLWAGTMRPGIYSSRLMSSGMLLFGISLSLMSSVQYTAVLLKYLAPVYFFIIGVSLILSVPLLMHSLAYFPFERKRILSRKYLINIPYYLAFVNLGLILINLFVSTSSVNTYFINGSLIFYAAWYPLIFIVFRDKKGKRSINGKTITFSYFAILVFMVSLSLLSRTGQSINPLFNLVFLLLPLSYIFTIAKYGLYDELIKISRNIQYSLLTISLNIIIYVLIILSIIWFAELDIPIPNIHFNGRSIEVLDNPLSERSQVIYEKILIIIFVGFIAMILFRAKNKLLERLNSYFHIADFDYKRAINEFNESFSQKLDKQELVEIIGSKISELLKIKQTAVIVFENSERISNQYYHGVSSNQLVEYSLSIEKQLFDVINDYSGNAMLEYFPDEIKDVYINCGFIYAVPIKIKSKYLGLILSGEKKSEANYRTEDLSFLSSIAKQAAIIIENVSLYSDLAKKERIQQELDIARRIQLSSLPQSVPEIKGLDIFGYTKPALEVGGDFYDFYLDDKEEFTMTTVIGDVSGKGTSAALYMSKIQGIMRSLQEFKLEPKQLLIKTNLLIYNYLEKGSFITASVVKYDSINRKIIYSRAGHLPLYHFKKSTNEIQKYTPKGLVLGMNIDDLFNRNLEEMEINYNEGDIFILITDGILEARNADQRDYEEERLLQVIRGSFLKNAQKITEDIADSVDNYTGREDQFDDMTVLVIKAL